MEQLSVPVDMKVQDLLVKLQTDHTCMLHRHLMTLKQTYTHNMNKEGKSRQSEEKSRTQVLMTSQSGQGEVSEGQCTYEVTEPGCEVVSVMPIMVTEEIPKNVTESDENSSTVIVNVRNEEYTGNAIEDTMNIGSMDTGNPRVTMVLRKRGLDDTEQESEIQIKRDKTDDS